MLRTLFTIGLVAVVGLFAVKIVFGLLGPLVALLLVLLGLALKIGVVLLVLYLIMRVVSPDTASRFRAKFRD